jgi:mitogen-activated protein kinase 1/3
MENVADVAGSFSPTKRMTVQEALNHPYLAPYHDANDEPGAEPLLVDFFDFENRPDKLDKEMLKRESDGVHLVQS